MRNPSGIKVNAFIMKLRHLFAFFVSALVLLLSFSAPAQNWDFKKEKDGIKIYTRVSEDSPVKELRMVLELETNLSTIVAVFNDIPSYPKWVYKTSEARLLEKLSSQEVYYYSKSDLPWPIEDRDVVLYSSIQQNPHTRVVTSTSLATEGVLDEVSGITRIKLMESQWTFTPIAPGKVRMEYHLKSDPGGYVPAWLVNMALDQGPIETINRFRTRLQLDKYKNRQIAGIVEKH